MRHCLPLIVVAALAPPMAAAQEPLTRPPVFAPARPTTTPGLLPRDLTPPGTPPLEIATRLGPKTTRFDPHAAEVRLTDRRWQLWSGKTLLKDFGDHRQAAYEARRLVADLRLDEHGVLGTPEPVMEFWLSGGQAPPLPGRSRNVIPFDPTGLRVVDDQGSFKVADERRVLFDFGPHAGDAHQALAVIQRFNFNELGLIGEPQPVMTYLLHNPNSRGGSSPAQSRGTQVLPQQSPRHPLDLPGLGRVGERRPFDPFRMEIHRGPDGWRLSAGPHDVATLGTSEYQARTAMQVAQRYPLTEQIRIGTGSFSFYLSNGQAPRGVPLGVRRTHFDPKLLTVKPAGGSFHLSDGRVTLATCATTNEANVALRVVQYYGFNCLCEAGQGLNYLAIDR